MLRSSPDRACFANWLGPGLFAEYGAAFAQHGFDSLEVLSSLTDDQVAHMLSHCVPITQKTGHGFLFLNKLAVLRGRSPPDRVPAGWSLPARPAPAINKPFLYDPLAAREKFSGDVVPPGDDRETFFPEPLALPERSEAAAPVEYNPKSGMFVAPVSRVKRSKGGTRVSPTSPSTSGPHEKSLRFAASRLEDRPGWNTSTHSRPKTPTRKPQPADKRLLRNAGATLPEAHDVREASDEPAHASYHRLLSLLQAHRPNPENAVRWNGTGAAIAANVSAAASSRISADRGRAGLPSWLEDVGQPSTLFPVSPPRVRPPVASPHSANGASPQRMYFAP